MSHWNACEYAISILVPIQCILMLIEGRTDCESSDHENSDWETVPETPETYVSIYSGHGMSSSLACLAVGVQLGNHDICT